MSATAISLDLRTIDLEGLEWDLYADLAALHMDAPEDQRPALARRLDWIEQRIFELQRESLADE